VAEGAVIGRVCSVEGCDRPHKGRGYCKLHWRRWKERGETGGTESWEKTRKRIREKDGATWVWCGAHPGEDGATGAWLPADAFALDPRKATPYRSRCRACAQDRERELAAERAPAVPKAPTVPPKAPTNRYQHELCEMVVCADRWLETRGLSQAARADAIVVTEEAYAYVLREARAGTLTRNAITDRFMQVPLIASDLPRAKSKRVDEGRLVLVLRERLKAMERAA
jgi:hypothetical protein